MAFAASYRDAPEARRRLGPLAAAILLHVLAVTILLLHKNTPIPRMAEQALKTIMLPPAKEEGEEPDRTETKQEEKRAEQASAAPEAKPEPPVEPPKAEEQPDVPIGPSWLTMSRAEFAASDIGRMSRAQRSSETGTQGDSKATYGPGAGPGGAQLYDPDWYRRPTAAELNGYLAASSPSKGWGLVACQTVADYRVENCQTLGEYPLGSGFGRAVRQAAWQFRVLPPRINGKPQIGAWVRIRISYGTEDVTS